MFKKILTRLALLTLAVAAAGALLAAFLLAPGASEASSHREAPLISKDPFADNTDTYVWIPEGQTDNIALAASWIPFEAPEGGPNYWEWDDRAAYHIHVDNDGDAMAEVTYTLRSKTHVRNPLDTFLYNTGPIDSLDDPDWNRYQTYTVTEQWEGMAPQVLIDNAFAPPVNIGSKSTDNYQDLWMDAIYTEGVTGQQIKIFAGQTDDPFFIDIQIFDLLTLRGQEPPIGYAEGNNIPIDSLSGFNVHSLVLEIPVNYLRDGEPVLGVWSTTTRYGVPVFSSVGDQNAGSTGSAQVSRLGMPLVNEVVIPMGLKDTFNSIDPATDLSLYGTLQPYVEDPEVGNLLCALYGVPLPEDLDDDCDTAFDSGTPGSGRGDIFSIFLTGMVLENPFIIQTASGPFELPAGFNINKPETVQPAEMLRINTAISGTLCAPTPSRLGILGGDACGYPNGRRLADDVVEISLLAVAGAAYELLDDQDASFSFDPALIAVLDDNINSNDEPFLDMFPYIAVAQSGQSHFHENPFFRRFMPVILRTAEATGEAADNVSNMVQEHPLEAAFGGFSLLLALPALAWVQSRRRDDES